MSARKSTYQPVVERLEQRELLAGNLQAYITGGNLYVIGSSGNDAITVTQNNNQISVAGTLINNGKGNVSSVSTSSFSNLVIYGEGGNDNIDLSTVKGNATVYGGTGNDTIKCGTGNDTVNNGGGFDTIYRPSTPGTPIVGGLSVSDIHQGQSPLCQTLAALGEAVQQGHNFGSDITYLGNNYYLVKLSGGLTPQKVYFDGWTTSNDPAPTTTGEFWPILMQRARLQAYGINPNQYYTTAQWNELNQDTGGRLYSIGQALSDFTGGVTSFQFMNRLTPQLLQSELASGKFLVAQSNPTNNYVSSDGIIGNHAYAVLGVSDVGGTWTVRLYNPWGVDSVNGRIVGTGSANDGYITLNWAQFTNSANFADLFIGSAG